MEKVLDIERVYIVAISEVVRHFHFHIIPRLFNQEIKGLSLIKQATQGRIQDKNNLTEEQLKDLIVKLRDLLSK